MQPDIVIRKLNLHIMTKFCALTLLNHMDRANLVSDQLCSNHADAEAQIYSQTMNSTLGDSDFLVQAYASVQLNQDLGYSDSVYGFAAGVFFVSYAIFQVGPHPFCLTGSPAPILAFGNFSK